MTRTHIVRFVALSVAALLGVAACSSGSDKTSVQDLSTIDATLPPGITLPPGVVIPGVTDECQAVYLQFITAMTSAYASTGELDYAQIFGDLSSKVPADLQDDMAILSAAFQQYGEILTANNNDPSSAEVQQAIQALGTPEVNAASETVQTYFEETCPAAT